MWIQHVYPTRRGEAVKQHPLHTDTPTLPGCLQALWANQTGNFIVPTALMSPAPQHCNSRESPARGHTVPVTQEKRRSKYAAEGRKKKLKISAQLHTLLLLSEQPPSQALVRINFKGHWKIPADLKQAGPLCVHTFYCHQHKMRRLGSTSNYKSNVVIKGDKTFWCYTLRKNYLYVALIS